MSMQLEVSVSPPETLVKFEAPLFAGIEPSASRPIQPKSPNQEGNPKLEDMLNSMLPPRCVSFFADEVSNVPHVVSTDFN